MIIRRLKLSDFRSIKRRTLTFSDKVTVIIGPNATGKTNIIESIYLLSTGKSFRAQIEEEMVRYESDIARVKGVVSNTSKLRSTRVAAQSDLSRQEDGTNIKDYGSEGFNLEVVLTRGKINLGDSKFERVPKKKLLFNGIGKRLIDFAGQFRTVLFGPWDMDIVTDAPSTRRKFLDSVISQVDREYRRASLSYEKGLRQRNKLLWQLRENPSTSLRMNPSTPYSRFGRPRLLFWDQLLVKNGDYITQKREGLIDFINSLNLHFPSDAYGFGQAFSNFQIDYDKSIISEARLEHYAKEEIAAASTLVGPHRDDFIFKVKDKGREVNERELARFGSRGEQRMGVLWLKLAELAFIESQTAEKPVLLLDDIFSELDHEHRKIVLDVIKGKQTIITTADPHYVEGIKKVEKIFLKD